MYEYWKKKHISLEIWRVRVYTVHIIQITCDTHALSLDTV